MRNTYFLALLIMPFLAAGSAPASAMASDNRVLVIGALHDLHGREPAFGYDRLRAAIVDFAPDVLVLEVRPDELAERKATPGRPEYPAVIWPLLAHMKVETVAMEPGGEDFKAITGEAGAAFETLKRRNPGGAAALSRLDTAAQDILLVYWQRAGQVQDETTAALAAGVQAAQFALAGPAFAAAQTRWENYMSGQVLHAMRSHPGGRVMVIGSHKNRAMLERAVREAAPQRAINAQNWFERMAPAAAIAGEAQLPR